MFTVNSFLISTSPCPASFFFCWKQFHKYTQHYSGNSVRIKKLRLYSKRKYTELCNYDIFNTNTFLFYWAWNGNGIKHYQQVYSFDKVRNSLFHIIWGTHHSIKHQRLLWERKRNKSETFFNFWRILVSHLETNCSWLAQNIEIIKKNYFAGHYVAIYIVTKAFIAVAERKASST